MNDVESSADGRRRIDRDENAVTGDTRIRVESNENDTYVLKREEYDLVRFTDEDMGDEEDLEEYDWHVDETFVLHGKNEAEQCSALLVQEGAFDPNVVFFRQREWDDENQKRY